jgi:hypothetical protein
MTRKSHPKNSATQEAKKYTTPVLTPFGRLAELTTGGSQGGPEGVAMSVKMIRP